MDNMSRYKAIPYDLTDGTTAKDVEDIIFH